MDPHIKKRFEKAQPFLLSEITSSPEYDHWYTIADRLENMMEDCFGGEVARLMAEYSSARDEMERQACLHGFRRGLLETQKKP